MNSESGLMKKIKKAVDSGLPVRAVYGIPLASVTDTAFKVARSDDTLDNPVLMIPTDSRYSPWAHNPDAAVVVMEIPGSFAAAYAAVSGQPKQKFLTARSTIDRESAQVFAGSVDGITYFWSRPNQAISTSIERDQRDFSGLTKLITKYALPNCIIPGNHIPSGIHDSLYVKELLSDGTPVFAVPADSKTNPWVPGYKLATQKLPSANVSQIFEFFRENGDTEVLDETCLIQRQRDGIKRQYLRPGFFEVVACYDKATEATYFFAMPKLKADRA